MVSEKIQRISSKNSVVSNTPFFSILTSEEVGQIEHLCKKRSYAKDEILLLEGQSSDFMYLIYRGKVRIVKTNEEGREQIITIHKRNDFFGEMSLLGGKTAPATIIAHEDAVIGVLTKKDFDKYLVHYDGFRKKIIELLCVQLRDSWEIIKILGFADNAEHRMVSLLLRLGNLYGVKDSRGVILNVKMTHQHMADYASLTRETASRVLKKLEKEGYICILENRVILLNRSFTMLRGHSEQEKSSRLQDKIASVV